VVLKEAGNRGYYTKRNSFYQQC